MCTPLRIRLTKARLCEQAEVKISAALGIVKMRLVGESGVGNFLHVYGKEEESGNGVVLLLGMGMTTRRR